MNISSAPLGRAHPYGPAGAAAEAAEVAKRAADEVLGGRGDARTIEAWAASLQPVRTLGHCPVNNVVLAVDSFCNGFSAADGRRKVLPA